MLLSKDKVYAHICLTVPNTPMNLRKVIGESQFIEIANRGFVTNPIRVNPLIKIW